jgi:hypothetical protein
VDAAGGGEPRQRTAAVVKPFAGGLSNPRGLKFGPDGYLYVAEGGAGGSTPVPAGCEGVAPPIGPYTGSEEGARISRIASDGTRSTVIDKLPSSQTSADSGALVSGVADIAFVGDTMYALLGGAGCSHGVLGVPNPVIRINAGGTWSLVADLSAYLREHPVANPSVGDFEPDGAWYSMISVNDDCMPSSQITANSSGSRPMGRSAASSTFRRPKDTSFRRRLRTTATSTWAISTSFQSRKACRKSSR